MQSLDIIKLLENVRLLERRLSCLLVDTGLSLPQFRLLQLLSNNNRLTVTEASAQLDVTKATITVLVQGSIKAGLVSAAPNPDDRRSTLITLTATGNRRLKMTLKSVEKLGATLGESLPKNTIRTLNRFTLIDTLQ